MVRMVVVVTAGAFMLAGCGTLFDELGLGGNARPEGAAAGEAAGALAPPGGDAGAAAALIPPTEEADAAASPGKPRNAGAKRRLPAVPSDAVRAMQLQLTALGYDPGAPDGLFGPRTRAALRRYQEDRGLIPDGKPTQLVMERVASESEQGSTMGGRLAQSDSCGDEMRRRSGFLRAAVRWIFAAKADGSCVQP